MTRNDKMKSANCRMGIRLNCLKTQNVPVGSVYTLLNSIYWGVDILTLVYFKLWLPHPVWRDLYWTSLAPFPHPPPSTFSLGIPNYKWDGPVHGVHFSGNSLGRFLIVSGVEGGGGSGRVQSMYSCLLRLCSDTGPLIKLLTMKKGWTKNIVKQSH